MPPSGREGDREAVEGARGYRSRTKDIATGGYGIRPYGERREEQAPPLPSSEYIGLPRPNTIFQFFILHSSLLLTHLLLLRTQEQLRPSPTVI